MFAGNPTGSFWLALDIMFGENILKVEDINNVIASKEITEDKGEREPISNAKIETLIAVWKHFGYELSVTKKRD